MNSVISGTYQNIDDLDNITYYMYNISKNKTTAHHIWINNITDNIYHTINKVRTSEDIYKPVKERFPEYRIKNVTDVDEIYYSASPKDALNSDRSLVDCHFDGPFAMISNNIIFYRIIVACNQNKDVITLFPNNNIKVVMDKGEFHGLNYNSDLHCVEGKIPHKKYRVLLKLHFILIPKKYNDNTLNEQFIRYINIKWTIISRYLMSISANPTNLYEYIIGYIVNISRFTYNNIYIFLLLLLFLIFIYYLINNNKIYKKNKQY